MNTKQKIVSLPTLKKKLKNLRSKKKIAFTNGCFDIFHSGHVYYLEKSKQKDRILVIGLNSDTSIRKIKGSKRPIITQDKRARVLAALACVDFVTIFNEETPEKLIANVKPDVLIKGADWKNKGAVGADFVKSIGGKVQYIELLPESSTTRVIQTIIKKCKT